MSDGTDVIFTFDGSFEGLMCCIFHCFSGRIVPSAVMHNDAEQLVFGDLVEIPSEADKAERVTAGIEKKMGRDVLQFIEKAFLSYDPDKDTLILRFVILGFRYGNSIKSMLADDTVNRIIAIKRHVVNEAHLMLGFVRFSQRGGVLVSVIEPKNSIIPLIAEHFCDRMRSERFVIYDKVHGTALFHETGRSVIADIDGIELIEKDESEVLYSGLWKTFFDTIEIGERYNHKCQRSHLPLRYRGNMTEFANDEALSADNENLIRNENCY